jgi:signal transduction histidine kinase
MFTPVFDRNDVLQRNIKITNLIALSFASLALILLVVTVVAFGVSVSTPYAALASAVYLSVILINRAGHYNVARILLAGFLPVITLYVTYELKSTAPHTDILYYDSRVILLASGLIPCLVFHTREKLKLYGLLKFNFLCLIMFDPIHEYFGQGYYQKGFTGESYYFINFIAVVAFIAISASALILKIISERAEEQTKILIEEKESINNDLHKKNEELKANQEKIQTANTIIKHQRNELTEHNRQLEKLVQEKSQKLIDTNEELIRHNQELQQFSYTVSHNLRSPIARLLGLTNILNLQHEKLPEEVQHLIHLIRNSSIEFDGVIRDLNKIIDVRNEFYRIKEKINFEQELEQAKKSVGEHLFESIRLNTNFKEEPLIYTVRPILNSILYNMLSNAIKYKSPQRTLELTIRTSKQNNYIVLEISDNGIGMDLDSYGKDVFGLYKRFHAHIEGRGLGLYLVKSQIESLGGKIEIKSKLNVGTSFLIYFKILTEIDGQICFSNDCCTLFYNAKINALGIVWKGEITSAQYRQIFTKSLEMMMLYNTPYWVSDMTKQGNVSVEDQKWMFNEIFPEAVKHGLRKGVCIFDPKQHNDEYRERLKQTSLSLGIETVFFQSYKAAEEWIEGQVKH